MTKEDDAVYIKNSAMSTHEREIRKLRHLKYADWQPEHEALGIEPIERTEVKEDFIMYSKRQPKPMPKPKVVMMPEQPVQKRPHPSLQEYPLPHPIPVSGNEEHLWQRAKPVTPMPLPPAVAQEEFLVEDIPGPPAKEYNSDLNMTFDDVEEGDYCIFISGKLICASSSTDEVEDMLNSVVFNDNPIPINDIVVVRKLKVKLGASLDER